MLAAMRAPPAEEKATSEARCRKSPAIRRAHDGWPRTPAARCESLRIRTRAMLFRMAYAAICNARTAREPPGVHRSLRSLLAMPEANRPYRPRGRGLNFLRLRLNEIRTAETYSTHCIVLQSVVDFRQSSASRAGAFGEP